MTNLETLKKQTADLEAKLEEMKAEIERLENGWEMKYPYKDGDDYYFLSNNGNARYDKWVDHSADKCRFNVGNVFPTEEAAELEAKRRNLLTRFRAFKDECNGDWGPDWGNYLDLKNYICCASKKELKIYRTGAANDFCIFGYFKNQEDAERAIELFGDEIKRLFVEV